MFTIFLDKMSIKSTHIRNQFALFIKKFSKEHAAEPMSNAEYMIKYI